jgi:hypothetical protein
MKKGICLILVLAFFCILQPYALAGAPGTNAGGSFEYILRQDGTACITRYSGTARALTIPGEIDGHVVKAVGEDAFPKGLAVSSILIPGSIREIGEGAFRFLDKLAAIGVINVNPVYASEQGVLFDKSRKLLHTYPRSRGGALYGVPRGIAVIAENAFCQCQYLQGVFVPSSVLTIGDSAFYGCKKVTKLQLSDGIKTIGGKAFAGINQLVSIKIPQSVSYIGPGAFLGCESLEDLRVDEDNATYAAINSTLVNTKTMLLHTCLQKIAGAVVKIPGGIEAIGDLAFSDCFRMKEVTIPESVESIGTEAFARCYNLSSIVLPGGTLVIGPNAFSGSIRLNMKVAEGSDAHQYAVDNGIPFELEIK